MFIDDIAEDAEPAGADSPDEYDREDSFMYAPLLFAPSPVSSDPVGSDDGSEDGGETPIYDVRHSISPIPTPTMLGFVHNGGQSGSANVNISYVMSVSMSARCPLTDTLYILEK